MTYFLILIITIVIFAIPIIAYLSPKNQQKIKNEQKQKPPPLSTLNYYTYLLDSNNRILCNGLRQPTRNDMLKMNLPYGIYFYRFVTQDQHGIIVSDTKTPINFLPPSMLYPKDVDTTYELLPFNKKQIIKNNEDKIFRAVTKICFAHKKYLFLQVRLLDVINTDMFFSKQHIKNAWVNFLSSKTIDYVFYDISKRKVVGALFCSKGNKKYDKEMSVILQACGIHAFMIDENNIETILPIVMDNIEKNIITPRNNYEYKRDKLYPKDFDFFNDILPLTPVDIFTDNEFRFFKAIATYAFNNKKYFTIKLRFSDFIKVSDVVQDNFIRKTWYNIISKKHTDFLLYDVTTRNPICCIEIDDTTHLKRETIERDLVKNNILRSAQIPIIRLRNIEEINASQELKKIIENNVY